MSNLNLQLLKITEPVIIKLLTPLINQVIHTGIFLDILNLANVIPTFLRIHLLEKITHQFHYFQLFQKCSRK